MVAEETTNKASENEEEEDDGDYCSACGEKMVYDRDLEEKVCRTCARERNYWLWFIP